jgi:DNA-binding GntR family transcriptional regulator
MIQAVSACLVDKLTYKIWNNGRRNEWRLREDWRPMPQPSRKTAAKRPHSLPQATLMPVAGRARPAPVSRATSAALVYERLHEDIIALRIEPGASLSENDLAGKFGVSRTPVREALLRLADDGLVEIVPKSGTTVSRIPYAQLGEAIVIRKALEEVAVREASRRATKSQITGLWAIVERQREAASADDRRGFHAADEAFHAAIAEVAGYPGIWRLVNQVKVQVDRIRYLTLPENGRMLRATKEHTAVLTAMEKHDGDRAVAAMRSHLEGLNISLPDIRRRNPDYFVDEVGVFELPGSVGRKTRSA